MATPWIGTRKLAVVPTFNTQFDGLAPDDWDNLIMRRVLYDPDPTSGIDRSLRAYLGAISYGRATLDAKLFPHAFSDGPGVVEAAWQSLPEDHGYEYVLCVIPFYDGDVNRKGWFTTVGQNGVKTVSRVAMYDNLRLKGREITGVWAMEVLHAIAGLPDLYYVNPAMGDYDNMTYNAGTHSCAYLKHAAGWLADVDIATPPEDAAGFDLHSIGVSPPPPGRAAAMRIPAYYSGSKFFVEARRKSDVYETGFSVLTTGGMEFRGLPMEGVIVYEGTAPNRLDQTFLRAVLQPGQTYTNAEEHITVSVNQKIDNGYSVTVSGSRDPHVRGRLLFYRDTTQNGTGDVHAPGVIGLGGWDAFRRLFAGDNGILYAVDAAGRLLFYRDWPRNGTGDVSNPSVIGQGGWQQHKFLFGGGDGVIYGVDPQGRLLFYRDTAQDGTNDLSNPAVIGQGGWQQFKFLFSGSNGIIYAVDQQGRLLFYRDFTRDGTGDVNTPSVIGQGGWGNFRFLFSGGNGTIYAVDQAGRLLFYRDNNQDGTGDVNTPSVIGQGGWQQFKFLFSGGDGILYAVVK